MSAPVLSPFPLDFGFWIWDLDLGPGFGTWIWDSDLGLDLGLTINQFDCYLVCQVAGPKFMEKREPYEIRGLMIAYNAFQVMMMMRMMMIMMPSRHSSASGCSRRAGPSTCLGTTAGTANQSTIQTMIR